MDTTPILGLPLLATQQAQAEILHNEALILIQALQLGAIDRGLNTPPASPAEGDVYIVGASPTGVWAGQANKIVIRYGGVWRFVPGVDSAGATIAMGAGQEGLKIYVRDEDVIYVWSGSAWVIAGVDPEVVRDTIASALVAGSNVTITADDAANTITIAASTDAEVVRDTMASALVAGSNVTITHNDAANTITIAASGGGGSAGLDPTASPYNAVADGVADDKAALDACFAAAKISGQIVDLGGPSRVYKVSAYPTIDGIVVTGNGAVITTASLSYGIRVKGHNVQLLGKVYVRGPAYGGTADQTTSGAGGSYGIYGGDVAYASGPTVTRANGWLKGLVIDGWEFDGFHSTGAYMDSFTDALITPRTKFSNCGYAGTIWLSPIRVKDYSRVDGISLGPKNASRTAYGKSMSCAYDTSYGGLTEAQAPSPKTVVIGGHITDVDGEALADCHNGDDVRFEFTGWGAPVGINLEEVHADGLPDRPLKNIVIGSGTNIKCQSNTITTTWKAGPAIAGDPGNTDVLENVTIEDGATFEGFGYQPGTLSEGVFFGTNGGALYFRDCDGLYIGAVNLINCIGRAIQARLNIRNAYVAWPNIIDLVANSDTTQKGLEVASDTVDIHIEGIRGDTAGTHLIDYTAGAAPAAGYTGLSIANAYMPVRGGIAFMSAAAEAFVIPNGQFKARSSTYGGNGDIEVSADKSATGDFAQFSAKVAGSVRSRWGALGTNDFMLDVSSNGSSFTRVLTVQDSVGHLGIGPGGYYPAGSQLVLARKDVASTVYTTLLNRDAAGGLAFRMEVSPNVSNKFYEFQLQQTGAFFYTNVPFQAGTDTAVDFEIRLNGGPRWRFTGNTTTTNNPSTVYSLMPLTDNAQDLGTSGRRIKDAHIANVVVSNSIQMGAGNTVIDANRLIQTRVYTIATLPAASGNANKVCSVSDGASNKRLVISDGSVWRYMDGASV